MFMNKPQRYIAHFDLDSFFVSVEVVRDPTLKGKAVLVGGHSDRGVVAACSYEARKFGIHSAMPMRKAMQLCPHAIVLGGTRGEYSKYSKIVTDIIDSKAPLFEKASIDEFYLDLTGMDKYFDPYKWTIELRQQIIDETQLPISFALASNKMVAKIATDVAKPNGYIQVNSGSEKDFLAPLKISKIPGVGDNTAEILRSHGIFTIKDLSEYPIKQLENLLGRYGGELWYKAQGIHEGEVTPYSEAKSISTESTFQADTLDMAFLEKEIVRMCERVGYELRQDEKLTGCLTVKLRYSDFSTVSKQTTIPFTASDDELLVVAKELFKKLHTKGRKVRLLGIRLSHLTNQPMQASLFADKQKKVDLYKAMDEVKNRFGKTALKKGRTI
ncbi:MAG: dinB [Segetibacter sp.]|nr:dinB [Segetibacter sp.]